jgi:competence protein ComEC
MIHRASFHLICAMLTVLCAARATQAAPRSVLIVDLDASYFGDACATVLAAQPETQVTRVLDVEQWESVFEKPWDIVIAVRPDPATWSVKAGEAWCRFVARGSTSIIIAGLPSSSESLLTSLGARSPAKVKTHFIRRFEKSFWIWPRGMTAGTARFRGIFDVKEPASFAPLRISADDAGAVWLNGQSLGEVKNWRSPLGMDVGGRLRQGRNVLCIEARNQDEIGGVIASLQAYDVSGMGIGELLTNRNWKCSTNPESNWTDPAFDDTAWAPASEVAPIFQGPWQANLADDDALFQLPLRAEGQIASPGIELGSALVPTVLVPLAKASVILSAGSFPVGVSSHRARTTVLSAIPDLNWENTLPPLDGSNAFWDYLLRIINAVPTAQANSIESFHLPRSLPGGRTSEIAARFNPSAVASGKAELAIHSSGKTILTKSEDIPASGAVTFRCAFPRACDVDRAVLVTLTVRDANGNPVDHATRFMALTDVVPVTLNNGLVRRVFRSDESIRLVAGVAASSTQRAGRWDIQITGAQPVPAAAIEQAVDAEWTVAPGSLAPGKYIAIASLTGADAPEILGRARFEFEVVKPLGAKLLQAPPAQASQVLRIMSLNVNVKNDIGDAHLIITPGGKVMLIDAGQATYGTDVVLPVLKANGISWIDWMIPSHMHDDHFGGMSELILNDSIDVKQFLWAPVPLQRMHELEPMYAADSERIMHSIESACAKRRVPMATLRPGQTIDLGAGVTIEILSAYDPRYRGGNYVNNNSVVMLLRYGEFSMMFTGDQGFEQEQRVMSLGRDISCDVLKIGHHAGAGSTGEDWVAALGAKVGIAPMPEFLSSDPRGQRVWNQLLPTGMKVYRTWEYGDVTVSSDGKSYWITTQKVPTSSPERTGSQ